MNAAGSSGVEKCSIRSFDEVGFPRLTSLSSLSPRFQSRKPQLISPFRVTLPQGTTFSRIAAFMLSQEQDAMNPGIEGTADHFGLGSNYRGSLARLPDPFLMD